MALGKKKMLHQAADTGVVGTENFAPVIYSGNSSTQAISGVGFQPDMVWIKKRSSSTSSDHVLSDSVRGASSFAYPNLTLAASTVGGSGTIYFNSFDSDGFTVGSSTYYNATGETYVAWCWNAGGTTVTDTSGDIDADIRANTAAGFSIVKYTGSGNSGDTVPHGLNSTPNMIIVKNISSNSTSWEVYHSSVSTADTSIMRLNSTEDLTTVGTAGFDVSEINSSTFTLKTSGRTNTLNDNYIAYCFHDVQDYQKIGSYTGSGGTQTINVGFQPRFVLIKRASGGDLNSWVLSDSARGAGQNLFANTSGNEVDESAFGPTAFTSTGFSLAQAGGNTNVSGSTYIYLAIA